MVLVATTSLVEGCGLLLVADVCESGGGTLCDLLPPGGLLLCVCPEKSSARAATTDPGD